MAEWTLTDADNGTVIRLRVGDVLHLRLPENPAAGYRWTLAPLDQTLLTVDEPAYDPSSGAVGSGGVATWRMHAVHAGTTRVELRKSRSWETGAVARFVVDFAIDD